MIYCVEDDASIRELTVYALNASGFSALGLECAEALWQQLGKEQPELILLDIMLPEIDGYELLEYIKPSGTPVIFLTAKGALNDRIRGLKLGADDYIVKPFQIGELLARVEALLRRYGKINKKLSFGDIEIDIVSRTVSKSGVPVELTAKEFDLLVELVQNKNVALYRERLYEKVWGEVFMGDTRTLDSHIQRLRRKLNWEKEIKTVFRVGYRLEGNE